MFKEKRSDKWYLEYMILHHWPGMLFALEINPSVRKKETWSIEIGLTVFYYTLFFVGFTKFHPDRPKRFDEYLCASNFSCCCNNHEDCDECEKGGEDCEECIKNCNKTKPETNESEGN